MTKHAAELFASRLTFHGEGPFWDDRSNSLLCLDVLMGEVIAISPSGESVRHKVPASVVTIIRQRTSGGFVIATESGLMLSDARLSSFRKLPEILSDSSIRTNDGGCDPLGSFVVGTMAYDEQPNRGIVYRVAPDGEVKILLEPVSISNGVQWSSDKRHVFYIDTPTRRIDMFDFNLETGAWSNRRTHIEIDGPGAPDGMAIDEEDGLWVALWGAGLIHHYDHRGRLVEAITVPGVSHVSSCTFGSTGLQTLYITTSRQGVKGNEPLAGSVFAVETQYRGAIPARYAG